MNCRELTRFANALHVVRTSWTSADFSVYRVYPVHIHNIFVLAIIFTCISVIPLSAAIFGESRGKTGVWEIVPQMMRLPFSKVGPFLCYTKTMGRMESLPELNFLSSWYHIRIPSAITRELLKHSGKSLESQNCRARREPLLEKCSVLVARQWLGSCDVIVATDTNTTMQ